MHYESIKKCTRHVAVFAAILIAASAHATCAPPGFDVPLDEQLALLPECQRNAAYLAQLGHLLISQGQYGDALEHLERALMFEPNLPAAQLDYAIALAGTGDLLSASQLLDGILAQPEISPDLRGTLTEARQRIARQQNLNSTPIEAQSFFTFSANLRYGRDSNLLGAPNISSLALTTPGGTVILPLADGSAERAGNYTRADVRVDYMRQQPDGSRWELAAAGLNRTSPDAPDANTRQTELTLGYSQNPRAPWAGYLSASWININTLGGTRYASQGINMGFQLPSQTAACRTRAGLDWQNRDIQSNPILSGYYIGINTLLTCAAAWNGQYQVAAKIGVDHPKDATRPGGDQLLASIRGLGAWATTGWGVPGTALVDLEYNMARDTTGYSPLLDSNAQRRTRRLTLRLEYQRVLTPFLLATLGAEWSAQVANLELFRVRTWGPYAALRFTW